MFYFLLSSAVSNKKKDGMALGNIHIKTGISTSARGIASKTEYGINFNTSAMMRELYASSYPVN